jgi:hypothetical protein
MCNQTFSAERKLIVGVTSVTSESIVIQRLAVVGWSWVSFVGPLTELQAFLINHDDPLTGKYWDKLGYGCKSVTKRTRDQIRVCVAIIIDADIHNDWCIRRADQAQ